MKRPPLTIWSVIIFVTTVALLNWLFLEFVWLRGDFRNSAYYDLYVDMRSSVLSPGFLLVDLVFVAYGLWWVFKPRKEKPVDEWYKARKWERLAVLAMMLGNIYGLLIVYFVKP